MTAHSITKHRRDNRGQPLFSVHHLKRYFGAVQAVDDISFCVSKGETLGIVGESGCGKSTAARLLVGLTEKDEGDLIFDGHKLGDVLTRKELWSGVQMVFQDSYASLNPRLTIEETLVFGPKMRGVSKDGARKMAHDMLARVGLAPERFASCYPHELSGGQRIRALMMRPKLVVLDEAVSALDKSVEAQVLNLLTDFKQEFDLTYIFITHDLNVARYICDRIMVMYLGQIVEIGMVEQVGGRPAHPYTSALFAAMPSMDPARRIIKPPLTGDPPNPINPPSGCRFHTRCKFATNICSSQKPLARPVLGVETHLAACHLLNVAHQGRINV